MRNFNRKCRKIRKLMLFDYDFFYNKVRTKMGNNMPKSESSAAETAKNAPCFERGAEKISLITVFPLQ